MQESCAACDSPLDDSRRIVTVGGRSVEVCCEECAIVLKEARASLEHDSGWTTRKSIESPTT